MTSERIQEIDRLSKGTELVVLTPDEAKEILEIRDNLKKSVALLRMVHRPCRCKNPQCPSKLIADFLKDML